MLNQLKLEAMDIVTIPCKNSLYTGNFQNIILLYYGDQE